MKFEYQPDVDALYRHLKCGDKPTGEDGDTVGIGDGCVVDVGAEGVPSGIDIHKDASKVVDLCRLEAAGPSSA